MRLFDRIFVLVGSIALALPAVAVTSQNAVTQEQVAAALSSAGMDTRADQVVFLTNVVATASAPALKIESTEYWSDQVVRVRLSCVKPQECLPFFVAVRGSQAQAVPPAITAPSSAGISRVKPDSIFFAMRSGAHVTLLLEGVHVHIQLPVVCLENGAIGQTIRVASLDHRLTYVAQVNDNRTLRGQLQ